MRLVLNLENAGSDVYVFGDHSTNADSDFYAINVPVSGSSLRLEIIEGDRTIETCESQGIDSRLTLYNAQGMELANVDEVVCTYVDALHYLVATPVKIAEGGNGLLLPRYRGWLVGVVAGERVRPVAPPVEVYFVTPDTPTGAVVERRT